jgi:hypothetical protein
MPRNRLETLARRSHARSAGRQWVRSQHSILLQKPRKRMVDLNFQALRRVVGEIECAGG